jgi:hypothetical protein
LAQHSFYLAFKKSARGYNKIMTRVTERLPSLAAGEVAMRVTCDLPDALFQRPLLSAKITIPKDKVTPATIDASVADNIADIVRQNLGIDLKIQIDGLPDCPQVTEPPHE